MLVGLVNLDTVRVDLQVADKDVARVQEGMRVQIHVDAVEDQLAAGGLEGEVISVGLAADPMTRTFPVRVVADNPGHLVRAGMHSRVLLVLESKDDALSVTEEALRTMEGQSYVMVAVGDRAKRVDVATGLVADTGIEILEGLDGSEQVITKGNFGLPDDALIEVAK